MGLTLSRKVPARTITITAVWCHKNFMEMCDTFREIRAKSPNPLDKCYWCERPHENGEMMAIANFGYKGNKTLCQSCADELLASGEK